MIDTEKIATNESAERDALRRRVKIMTDAFNEGRFDKCFALIDPKLTEQAKVDPAIYSQRLAAFKQTYGQIRPWHIRLNLHLQPSEKTKDQRPFAYVYVVWQDNTHAFHMFRERWVKEAGRWHTRVVGLVPNRSEPEQAA